MKSLKEDIIRYFRSRFLLVMVLDAMFLVLYGFIRNGFFTKIAEYLYGVEYELSLAGTNASKIVGSSLLSSYVQSIILLLILFYIVVFINYLFIHGYIWKVFLGEFPLKKFILINFAFLVIFMLDNTLRFLKLLSGNFEFLGGAVIIFWNVIMFLMVYMYFIFLSRIKSNNTIRDSLRYATDFSESVNYLFIFLLVFVLNYFTAIFPILTIPFGFLILFGLGLMRYVLSSRG